MRCSRSGCPTHSLVSTVSGAGRWNTCPTRSVRKSDHPLHQGRCRASIVSATVGPMRRHSARGQMWAFIYFTVVRLLELVLLSFVPNSPRRSSCPPCAACFPVHIGESSVRRPAPCRPGYAGSLPNAGRTPPVTRAVHPQHSGHLVNRFGWSSALDSPRRQPPDQLLLEGQ